MRKVWLAVLGLAVIGYGCGPQLAQSSLGQKETQWEGYVKNSYPSWAPAKTITPVEQQAANEQAQAPAPAAVEPAPTVAPISSEVQNPTPVQALEPIQNLRPLQALPELPDNQLTATPKHSGHKEYTIKKGDTLGGIAKSFYGNASKWRLIRDANPTKITDPNKLKAGTKISIPSL